MIVASDECEPYAELNEELTELFEEASVKLVLFGVLGQAEKLKIIWVFNNLLGEVGLWGRESLREVGNRFSLSLEKTTFDLIDKNTSTPSMFNGCVDIPFSL